MDFTEVHRQSVCDRQSQLHNGTLELRNALIGLELRPVLLMGNITDLMLQSEVIPEKNPGIAVEILDELANRAEFTWRNSFGVANFSTAPQGTTFDEILVWSVGTYDVSAIFWSQSVHRVNLGASFPAGWYDSSIILVGEKESTQSGVNVWSFLEPFSAGVWVMIAVTIVVSGLIYWWMERYNEDSDKHELGGRPTQPIFLAALSFTGEVSFQPSTDYARLFVISLAFWCLLICSTYTANLASFLVVQNTPSIRVESVGDAVAAGLSMCVVDSTANDLLVSKEHPGAKLVRLASEEETFLGIKKGQCDFALTSVGSWNRFRGQSAVNSDCNLDWIGRVFEFLSGGFATQSDSGTLCTSLIRDSLNLHLLEMTQDGFIKKAWERELERTSDVSCEVAVVGDDESGQLGLQDTGGLFIIHYSVAFMAIIMALFTKRKIRGGQICQRHFKSKDTAMDDHKTQSHGDSEPVFLTDSQASREHGLEAMYEKQSEQLIELGKQMNDMLTKLHSVQEESRLMGKMIQNGANPYTSTA